MTCSRILIARTILFTSIVCLAILGCERSAAQAPGDQGSIASPQRLSNPPEARSPVDLSAVNDPRTGKAAFSFRGREDPPVIRALPGEDIRLTYVNAMSTDSHESASTVHAAT